MKKQHFQKQQGFNLVELLIAVTLLGIGLALAVPAFTNLTKKDKIQTMSSEIRTALNYARNEAIRLNDNVVFCHSSNQLVCSTPPNTGWEGWIIRRAGANIGAETGDVLRKGIIDHNVVKVTSNATLSSALHVIRYNSQGLARFFGNNTPLSAQIEVCVASAEVAENLYSVRFNSGGRSEVVRINNSGVCP